MIVGQALYGQWDQAHRRFAGLVTLSVDSVSQEPTGTEVLRGLCGGARPDQARPDQARLGALGEFLQIHVMPEVLS
jgi:hypothetical protein